MRRDKQEELERICNEIEENARERNSRIVFQMIRQLTGSFRPHTMAIKDSRCKKLVKPGKVNQGWKEYHEELYDDKVGNIKIETDTQGREPPPLTEEIRQAVLKSGTRKAPGLDDAAIELLKFGGKMTMTKLHKRSV